MAKYLVKYIHHSINDIIVITQIRDCNSHVSLASHICQSSFFHDADLSTTRRFSRNDTLSLYKHHYLITLNIRLSNGAVLYVSASMSHSVRRIYPDIHCTHTNTHTRARINADIKIIRALSYSTLFEGLHYERSSTAYGCSCQGR